MARITIIPPGATVTFYCPRRGPKLVAIQEPRRLTVFVNGRTMYRGSRMKAPERYRRLVAKRKRVNFGSNEF